MQIALKKNPQNRETMKGAQRISKGLLSLKRTDEPVKVLTSPLSYFHKCFELFTFHHILSDSHWTFETRPNCQDNRVKTVAFLHESNQKEAKSRRTTSYHKSTDQTWINTCTSSLPLLTKYVTGFFSSTKKGRYSRKQILILANFQGVYLI